MEIMDDMMESTGTAMVEILGAQYRARAPKTQLKALEQAMREVQDQTTRLSGPGRSNERIAVQAAVAIAFNALMTERGVQSRLDKLTHQMDVALEESGGEGWSG